MMYFRNLHILLAVSALLAAMLLATACGKDDNSSDGPGDTPAVVPVTGVSLDIKSHTLAPGAQLQLTATVYPENATNKNVKWGSTNPIAASVSDEGLVTATLFGMSTIRVKTEDGGKTDNCIITVKSPEAEVTDLSQGGSANCYIVSSAGRYSFRAVQGNSDNSVGSVAKAEVLWESFGTGTAPSKGDIIKTVSYAGNAVSFQTASPLKDGNALIAVKNSAGTILWSWHIWVCGGYDAAESAHTYYNKAGKMMDRNLGAISATPGNVGALGLLYQWGRKDPFPGGAGIKANTPAATTLTWPSPVQSSESVGTIEYATAHPTIFIMGKSSGGDWSWTEDVYPNLRWAYSKTIYDPCPPGWTVPSGHTQGVWAKAGSTLGSMQVDYDTTKGGIDFGGKFGNASSIWYPGAGSLRYDSGALAYVGNEGLWWSFTPYGEKASMLHITHPYDVNVSSYSYRANGYSVRCLKAE